MAAAAITKVIINLLSKHGMSKGVMKADLLGFNRGQISKAIQKFNKSAPQDATNRSLYASDMIKRLGRTGYRTSEAEKLIRGIK